MKLCGCHANFMYKHKIHMKSEECHVNLLFSGGRIMLCNTYYYTYKHKCVDQYMNITVQQHGHVIIVSAAIPDEHTMTGHRQKRAAASGSDASHPKRLKTHDVGAGTGSKRSPTVQCLLSRWAWGELSATTLQDIAHNLILSGFDDRDISTIASLGSHGTNPGSIHKDLMRIVQRSATM